MAESVQIKKLSNKHEAILQYIVANPTLKYKEVAAHFGVSIAWLSIIINSSAFKEQLAVRQDELFDAAVLSPLSEKLSAAADMTLEQYMEQIPNFTADQAITANDKIFGRLGYGAQKQPVLGDNNNVQVNHYHVNPQILAKAREKIGATQVGASDSPAALSDKTSKQGTEIEGVAVREES